MRYAYTNHDFQDLKMILEITNKEASHLAEHLNILKQIKHIRERGKFVFTYTNRKGNETAH